MKERILKLLAEKNIPEEMKEYFYENIDTFDDFKLNLIFDSLTANSENDFVNVLKKNNAKIEGMRNDLKVTVRKTKRGLYLRAEEELDKWREDRLKSLLRQM